MHNNDLFIFDKESGEIVKQIPTEETIVKNQFINNLSLNQESIFFINTFGSLYSINKKNMFIPFLGESMTRQFCFWFYMTF